MFRRKQVQLNSKTPAWFKDWHSNYFLPVKIKASRNEKLIYVILAAVIALNTAGNYYHEEIFNFIMSLFGG